MNIDNDYIKEALRILESNKKRCRNCSHGMDIVEHYVEECIEVGFSPDEEYTTYWCSKCGTLLDSKGKWRKVGK